MSSLEAYILKKYGKFVPFDIASEELGFDVLDAVACVVTKAGSVLMRKEYICNGVLTTPRKTKATEYEYNVPVMSSLAVRGNCIRYAELAHLLNLNMHIGVEHD